MNISERRHEMREKELERWAKDNDLTISREGSVFTVTDSEGFPLEDKDGDTEFDFVELYKLAFGDD